MRGKFYLSVYINGIKYYYNTSGQFVTKGKMRVYNYIYYPIHRISKLNKELRIDYADVTDENGNVMFSMDNRFGKSRIFKNFV
jgi:hypothetical protein